MLTLSATCSLRNFTGSKKNTQFTSSQNRAGVIPTQFNRRFSLFSGDFGEEGALLRNFTKMVARHLSAEHRNARFFRKICATCGYFSTSETIRLISDKNFYFGCCGAPAANHLISFSLLGRSRMEGHLLVYGLLHADILILSFFSSLG